MKRGEIWWATLPEPVASEPGYSRPVLIISDDSYNTTTLRTVITLTITSNLDYARLTNNVFLAKEETGLEKDSVINMTQLVTVDKSLLTQQLGTVPQAILVQLNDSLKTVLGIW